MKIAQSGPFKIPFLRETRKISRSPSQYNVEQLANRDLKSSETYGKAFLKVQFEKDFSKAVDFKRRVVSEKGGIKEFFVRFWWKKIDSSVLTIFTKLVYGKL